MGGRRGRLGGGWERLPGISFSGQSGKRVWMGVGVGGVVGGEKGFIESRKNYRTFSSRGSQAGGFGWGRCGRGVWRGVGKASLNLIKITELSARKGLDGGSVWARGVAGGERPSLNLIKFQNCQLSGQSDRKVWMGGRCGRSQADGTGWWGVGKASFM